MLSACKSKKNTTNLATPIPNVYYDYNEASLKPLDVQYLNLRNKELTIVDTTILQFKQLIFLNLMKNQLKDLPNQLFTLTKLEDLNLRDNKFTELPN